MGMSSFSSQKSIKSLKSQLSFTEKIKSEVEPIHEKDEDEDAHDEEELKEILGQNEDEDKHDEEELKEILG